LSGTLHQVAELYTRSRDLHQVAEWEITSGRGTYNRTRDLYYRRILHLFKRRSYSDYYSFRRRIQILISV